MAGVHACVRDTAIEFRAPDYLMLGANVAEFMRVADAMIEQGPV
jgi:glutamate dehydrogenase (NADP+)